jgi:hypothetical protein
MRLALAAAVLLAAQCLSGCGIVPGTAAGGGGAGAAKGPGLFQSGPAETELMQALERTYPGHPIAMARLEQCQEGRVDGKTVQVCGFCFVGVGLAYSDNAIERGAYLKAVRRGGSAVFRRAISAEQPEVEPAPGQRGVWLASSIRTGEGVRSEPLSRELMRQAGHLRRPGFGTFVKWVRSSAEGTGPLGEAVDEEVARKFAADATLRKGAADLVGACGR